MLLSMKSGKNLFCVTLVAVISLMSCDDLKTNAPMGGENRTIALRKTYVRPYDNLPTTFDSAVVTMPYSHPQTGILPLRGILRVPSPAHNSFASIRGRVRYSQTSMPYRGAFRIELGLNTAAILMPACGGGLSWRVEGKSQDRLFIVPHGRTLIEKRYTVARTEGPMILHVRFLLTSERISLNGMWLEAPRGMPTEKESD